MLRLIFISVLTLFFTCTGSMFAQVNSSSTYKFLDLVSSARQIAIGGRVISIADDDVNFANWNPSALNSQMHSKLALNYTNYFSDVNYGSASFAYEFDSIGVFFASAKFVDYGKFILSESGLDQGEFGANELALSLGYSYIVDSLLSVGASVKIINSVLYQWNSYGIALDLGAQYKIPGSKAIVALVLRNIGTQLKPYNGSAFDFSNGEKLPFEIQLGFSQELEHLPLMWNVNFDNLQRWKLAFSNPSFASVDINGDKSFEDINFADEFIRHITIGAELFPRRNFSLRASYNFRRAAEMKFLNYKYFGGFSFGFGMKIKKFNISFARSLYHPAGGTNHFSITTDLSKF